MSKWLKGRDLLVGVSSSLVITLPSLLAIIAVEVQIEAFSFAT